VRVVLVVGTRPEVVKMAPIHRALVERKIESKILSSGQQAELVQQALDDLGLHAYYDARVMLPRQSLPTLTSKLVLELTAPLRDAEADLVLVQGDTATALGAALAAFYLQLPVGHVEAGLRTGSRYDPFPEEMNRRLITQLSTLHFAPTNTARIALRDEGVNTETVHTTGNPVLDELYRALWKKSTAILLSIPEGERVILVTCHRRENLTAKLAVLCTAIGTIADEHRDAHVIWPLHPNPAIGEYVRRHLTSRYSNVHIVPPQPYSIFAHLLDRATLIVSDSGGVTEEAVALGKRLIVIRDTTERPEAVRVGNTLLPLALMPELPGYVAARLRAPAPQSSNAFGDGHAGERIAGHIATWLQENR
jgi:UDP-N-acetylglucosamine 2-epimerase (non-hydrolysing)